MSETPDEQRDDERWVVTHVGPSGYRADIRARTHAFATDEPRDVGGTDVAPTPYEYLLAALGGCMALTLRMYADRKGWPLQGARVRLRTARVHADDCASCETTSVGPHRLERRVELDGPLSEEQQRRLLQIADRCPVKQTLERGLRIDEGS